MRYAANLLFQYGVDGRPAVRPLCEKGIFLVTARSPKEALTRALALGRRERLSYRNAEGRRFRIRLLAAVDLIERRQESSVFRTSPKTIQSAWWAMPAEYAAESSRVKPQRRHLKRAARHR